MLVVVRDEKDYEDYVFDRLNDFESEEEWRDFFEIDDGEIGYVPSGYPSVVYFEMVVTPEVNGPISEIASFEELGLVRRSNI